MEEEPLGHPLVADGTVKHGQINVDPAPLNRHGFRFRFTKDFVRYRVRLEEKDGDFLNSWDACSAGSKFLLIQHLADFDLLEYDTEYNIVIDTLDSDCDSGEIVIQFRTKPWRHGIERPAPVRQQQTPVVPLGAHLRIDISPPQILFATVWDGQDDVDPIAITVGGIRFDFDENLKMRKVDILHDGKSLPWTGTGLVEHVTQTVTLTAVAGAELQFDTEYVIKMCVQDLSCHSSKFEIRFRTKPKP